MVKTKKISKQSIVIIALSLLLVLSMIMSLSGAWFTDKDYDGDETNIDFGAVRVSVGQPTGVISYGDDAEKFVPGDYITLSGSAIATGDEGTPVASTVDVYIRLIASAVLQQKVGEDWVTLGTVYLAETGADEAFTIGDFIASDMDGEEEGLQLADGWEAVAGLTGYYSVAAGSGAQSLSGVVTFAEASENVVYVGEERVEHHLNGVVGVYRLAYEVTALAVQKAHITEPATNLPTILADAASVLAYVHA